MSENEKQPYIEFATPKAQKEKNEEWWDGRLLIWKEERRERSRSSGVELDPGKRKSIGLEPLCELEMWTGL